jgi:hypothetical protein
MGTVVGFVLSLVRAALVSRASLALENAALRQQLGTYLRRKNRPRLKPSDRALWVLLCRIWPAWRDTLAFVKPATVIAWHRQGFRVTTPRARSGGTWSDAQAPSAARAGAVS